MKSRILLLTTGGTIASLPTDDGLAPGLDGEDLAELLPRGVTDSYDITIQDILHLDSSNIQPEEWQTIARHVFAQRGAYDGIVITHGTDTMAYTASILSFMLRGISIPVVLTGAQLPMTHPLSDGMENLRTALAMAASGVAGVFLEQPGHSNLGNRTVLLLCQLFTPPKPLKIFRIAISLHSHRIQNLSRPVSLLAFKPSGKQASAQAGIRDDRHMVMDIPVSCSFIRGPGDRDTPSAPWVFYLIRQAEIRTRYRKGNHIMLICIFIRLFDSFIAPVRTAEDSYLSFRMKSVHNLHHLSCRDIRIVPVEQIYINIICAQLCA